MALRTETKIFLVLGGLLTLVSIGSVVFGVVCYNRLRNDPNKDRVRSLEERVVDLEGQLRSGSDSLAEAIRERDEASVLAGQLANELDGYRKRLDDSKGAIGRGEGAVDRVESLLDQIKNRGPVD